MPDIFNFRIDGTSEVIPIQDPEPLPSAVRFKALSDNIWARVPDGFSLVSYAVPSVLGVIEARDALNEIVRDIDDSFVVSGIGKALNLGHAFGKDTPVVVDADVMHNPRRIFVEVFNWDRLNLYRNVVIDGEDKVAVREDGLRDYHRGLGIKIGFGNSAVATYEMQRMQAYQDRTTKLSLSASHHKFKSSSFTGIEIADAPITQDQEMQLLDLIQRMTGAGA